jgi:enamine deaminase RidA (YjgF/YER057c/UK114 family)
MSEDQDLPGLEPVNPRSLGLPRGYSHGILAPADGRLLFIAGQIAWDERQRVVCDDFRGQFAQALNNVVTVLRRAGGKPQDLAQLTIYVADRHEYLACLEELGESYRLVMGKHYPAMALVEVQALLEPRAKVEIQGIAVISGPAKAIGEASGSFSVTEIRKAVSKGAGR